jgi:carbonic anhydrase
MYAINGYKKFKEEKVPQIKDKLSALEKGQSPKTLFVTCADSRICANEMTQTDFGELFVIRNAGNSILPSNETNGDADQATLEYAVLALGVEEIVICGHSHCGLVTAALSGVDKSQLKYIDNYLGKFESLKSTVEEKGLSLVDAIHENVRNQMRNVLSYDFVKTKVASGELKIHGWFYTLETGDVEVVETIDASYL